jgi:hypothetical protein
LNPSCQTDCGVATQDCCGGNQCAAGARCVQGKCEACGGSDEACCPMTQPGAEACQMGLRCVNQKCTSCGAADEACCRTGNTLFCDRGLTCDADLKCTR